MAERVRARHIYKYPLIRAPVVLDCAHGSGDVLYFNLTVLYSGFARTGENFPPHEPTS